MGIAVPQAGPGPEVRGHQAYRLVAVDQRFVEALLKVISDGPLVIRLGKVRRELYGAAEMFQGAIEFSIGEALRATGQLVVGGRRAAAEPDRPEGMLGHLI